MARDAQHASYGCLVDRLFAHPDAGRIAHEQPLYTEEKRQGDNRNTDMPDPWSKVVEKRVIPPLSDVVGTREPDQEAERSQREQAKIRSFSNSGRDRVSQARAGNKQVKGQERASRGNEHRHVIPLPIDRMLTR